MTVRRLKGRKKQARLGSAQTRQGAKPPGPLKFKVQGLGPWRVEGRALAFLASSGDSF